MPGPVEVTRQQVATHNVTSTVGAEVMAEQTGQRRQEATSSSNATSKLLDAAEELGMAASHRANKKDLGTSVIRQGQGTNFEALKRIAEYYDKLPDMPREEELRRLVDTFKDFQDLLEGRKGGQQPTKEDILAALHSFDRDVTHQFAALDIAQEYFAAEGASDEFQSLLAEAREEFEKPGLVRDVRAGFAVAEVASDMAETLETDPATVRESYRMMLREQMNMGQLFDNLSKYNLKLSFEDVVDTFLKAAGHDLSSADSSVDPVFLQGLSTELGKLKKMQTVYFASQDLIDQTQRAVPDIIKLPDPPTATTISSRIFHFVSKPTVNAGDAKQLLSGFEDAGPSAPVVFSNGMRDLLLSVPDDVLPSPQSRQQQTSILLSVMDDLVEIEEVAFEEGETA